MELEKQVLNLPEIKYERRPEKYVRNSSTVSLLKQKEFIFFLYFFFQEITHSRGLCGSGTDICCHYTLKFFKINVVFPLTVFRFNLMFLPSIWGKDLSAFSITERGRSILEKLGRKQCLASLGGGAHYKQTSEASAEEQKLGGNGCFKIQLFLEISGDLGLLLWSCRKGVSFCERRCFCEGINIWILYFFRYFKRPYFKSGGGCDQITPAEKFLQEIGKS